MSDRLEPINAIMYAQFHLKGGLRNTLIGVAIASLTVGGTCAMALSLDPLHRADVGRAGAFILLALQWLALGVYGTSRVSAAVRHDVTSGILESHRLTPTSPLAAAVGYVIGGSIQAIALGAVLFVIGLGMCLIGGVPIYFWLTANLMTLAMSATAWVLVALIAFGATNGAVMPLISAISIVMGTLFSVVPAMAVLTAPLTGKSLFDFAQRGRLTLPVAYAFTLVGQMLIAGVLLLAIARRYRNAATPAFSITLAVLLTGMLSAITLVGLVQPDLFLPTYLRSGGGQTRLVAGLVSLLLIGLIPLVAIARRASNQRLGRITGRGLPAWLTLTACVAIATLPVWITPATSYQLTNTPRFPTTTVTSMQNGRSVIQNVYWTPPNWGLLPDLLFRQVGTVMVAGSMFAGLALLIAWQFLGGRGGWVLPFMFILLPNALPPLADAVMQAADQNLPASRAPQTQYTALTGFSPLGALIMLWDERPRDAAPGLAGQAALALLPAGLYLTRRPKLANRGRGFPARFDSTAAVPAE